MARPAYQGRSQSPWRNAQSAGWAEYTRLKNEWIKKNPQATTRDIDQAARRIAKELGL